MTSHAGSLRYAAALLAASLILPSGVTTQAHAADGHPARIQEGTCDALGRAAFRLTAVGAEVTPDGTPLPAPETFGAADSLPIAVSVTSLQSSLSELTKEPYAIAIYESDEAMDRVIACGNVGGIMKNQMVGMIMPGDRLLVWLGAQSAAGSGSGYTGVATLRSVAGGTLDVAIALANGQVAATPEDADHHESGTASATPGTS